MFKLIQSGGEMTVDSMQINNEQVTEAKTGNSIGVKVSERLKSGDLVFI